MSLRVEIFTADLDAVVAFYTEILGFTLVHRPASRWSWRWTTFGRSMTAYSLTAGPSPSRSRTDPGD
jgi:catechol 2,3-dioxygenase-like lactoylglutathione lyase family enzyme